MFLWSESFELDFELWHIIIESKQDQSFKKEDQSWIMINHNNKSQPNQNQDIFLSFWFPDGITDNI